MEKYDTIVRTRDELATENRELRAQLHKMHKTSKPHSASREIAEALPRYTPHGLIHQSDSLLHANVQRVPTKTNGSSPASLMLDHSTTGERENARYTPVHDVVGTIDYDEIALDFVMS